MIKINKRKGKQSRMNVSGAHRYNFEQLREQVNDELLNKDMPNKLYKSTNGIFRVIDAIVKTHGEDGWAAQVSDDDGKELLTPDEQVKFTKALKPYIESILDFFNQPNTFDGGAEYTPNIPQLSGLSDNFIKSKLSHITGNNMPEEDPEQMFGIDDVYSKIVNRINKIDNVVNDYASKYGVLKLEKEHDLEPDPRIIPQAAAAVIAEGVTALSAAAGVPIPPTVTMDALSKVKIPFRLIISGIYLALDVSRIVMAVSDRTMARKMLSIVLSILELLRGDWKKATLSFIGYYGTTPLFIGEILKAYLSLYRQLSPQLQESIVFGSLDATKSLFIGMLLSIFQVTAPEEIRLPLIGILEKIAQKKAELDGSLEEAGLSARPDYLAPTFEDLNNLQAVMSDKAFLCSCEFEDLIKIVNKTTIIKIILQILRIPVTEQYRELKCGKEVCKPLITSIVNEAKEAKDKEIHNQDAKIDEPITEENFSMPVSTGNIGIRGGRLIRASRKLTS